MRIVVDAMGGDFAPRAIVEGVVEAIRETDVHITLVGIQEKVEEELNRLTVPRERVDVVHATEVVGMNEPAATSIRKKKDSSITVGIELLKKGGYDAFISAGNTGAVVAASTIKLGMLPGVQRPAIGVCIPTLKNLSFVIDVGANTDPKPQHLLQSALMARVYVREVLGVEDPTVGLLNIGEEETKGTGFEKETYKLLEESVPNFIGNIEANAVYTGNADCVICDGFVGNVLIKVSAGLMESTAKLIKREIKSDPLAILGASILKWRFSRLTKLADYSEYGGAPLLGVNGVVMISHGRSTPKAIKNAIKAAAKEVDHNILANMIKAIEQKG